MAAYALVGAGMGCLRLAVAGLTHIKVRDRQALEARPHNGMHVAQIASHHVMHIAALDILAYDGFLACICMRTLMLVA